MLPQIYIRKDAKELLGVLDKYLPLSLPLIRRLQFMEFEGGQTEHSCILASFEGSSILGNSLVVAYLDYSRGPETEMWLFSTLENSHTTPEDSQLGERQLIALFHKAGMIEDDFDQPRNTPGSVLLGSANVIVLEVLRRNRLVERATVPYCKFVFHTKTQAPEIALPSQDFKWGSVRPEDIALVLSRTQIPRKERTMILLPSAAIFAGTSSSPIAWGFLGPDGSLTSLHCEEEYRGRGLAKAITLKLFRDYLPKFGPERVAHADVALDNVQSQGFCKSLGGTEAWVVYWTNIRTRFEG